MANSVLTLDYFKELLLTYGVDTSRWPGVTAEQAAMFLDTSAEARALFAEYAPVDTLMQTGDDDKAPDDLIGRIMNAIEKK